MGYDQESIEDIRQHLDCNTYAMSCHLNSSDLCEHLLANLKTAMAAVADLREENKRLRDENVQDFRMDELDAVMHSVDKWFNEGDPRLKDNPATRAGDAREIALQAIEKVSLRAMGAEAMAEALRYSLEVETRIMVKAMGSIEAWLSVENNPNAPQDHRDCSRDYRQKVEALAEYRALAGKGERR